MRRLLLAGLLTLAPLGSASAGPATCVVTAGIPACVGTCSPGDTVTVTVIGNGSGTASCGGATASCASLRAACTDSERATSFGVLTCSGSGDVVVCSASAGSS